MSGGKLRLAAGVRRWLSTLTRTNRVAGFVSPWFAYKRNTGASCTGAVLYRPRWRAAGSRQVSWSCFIPTSPGKLSGVHRWMRLLANPESEAFLQGGASGPAASAWGPMVRCISSRTPVPPRLSPEDGIARIVWKP